MTRFEPGGRAQPNDEGRLAGSARAALAGAAAVVAVVAGVGRRWFRRVQVHGPSMLPALGDGDRLLVRVTRRVRPGDVVVVRDPATPSRLVVKRAAELRQGAVIVLGDNPSESRDSRSFGPVRRDLIVGRAWWRYHPPSRAGRVARQAPGATGRG